MAPPIKIHQAEIYAPLARALVDHPQGTLQDLAQAIGISKATLYRFCGTREQLIAQVSQHALTVLDDAIVQARLAEGAAVEALQRLTDAYLDHHEFTALLAVRWRDLGISDSESARWEQRVDALFLRGQEEGVFRIDMSAAALTEMWTACGIGLIEAEQRGRVARTSLKLTLQAAFLHGALR